MEFSDGMKFNLNTKPHVEHRRDGWYAVGNGMLSPEDSREEAQQVVDEWLALLKQPAPLK